MTMTSRAAQLVALAAALVLPPSAAHAGGFYVPEIGGRGLMPADFYEIESRRIIETRLRDISNFSSPTLKSWLVVRSARRIGENHLRLSFGDGSGPKLEAVAFGAFDAPLGPALSDAGHQRFHLAGRLEINTWGGRSRVQLRLEDAARA